ncbi:MAG: NADPH:quinone reductase [Mycobacterium sp.]|nr:NADPH:quinone reductase [Mycobacterium sp.]
MRALHFDRFGDPNVLQVAENADPVAENGQAVIAVKAASVNPSDVKNVAGAFPATVLPRVPGRDFAGVVLHGPADWIGAEVWGTGGDIGFSRDGSHAELLAVPVEALARKPEQLSFEEAATVGVNFVTGWLGAIETAQLQKDETIAVFGVSGGVGGAVAQIAAARGARVIGIGRTPPRDETPAATILEEFIALDGNAQHIAAQIRRVTGGRGAEVVYDAVGGVTTDTALAALAPGGRLVVISAVGTRVVEIDLVDFYRNETRLLGCNSAKLGVVESGTVLGELAPYFESGAFRSLPISRSYGLAEGQDAYAAVAGGTAGRIVIRP